MGKGCSIPNCPNSKTYGKYVKGFGFPKSEELRKRWVSIIQMNHPGWIVTKYPRFCSLHFDKNDIIDGKNHKLQYSAVPVYFNENIRVENESAVVTGGNSKISALLAEMQHNQLLYSSDSECEYQVVVKVTKKPRNSGKDVGDTSGTQSILKCVHCHKNKKNAVEMQAHLRTIHNVIVDIVTPKGACVQIKEGGSKNYMCSICGLVFKNDPNKAFQHMEVSHKLKDVEENVVVSYRTKEGNETFVEMIEDDNSKTQYELVESVDGWSVEAMEVDGKSEYVFAETEETYVTVMPKEEMNKPEFVTVSTEDDFIEENVQTTFRCRVCDLDFMDKDDIKTHIMTEHTVSKTDVIEEESSSEEEKDPYEPICYICSLQCPTLPKMRKHMKKTHNTEEYYFCQHCTGTFLSLDMYQDHDCLVQAYVSV